MSATMMQQEQVEELICLVTAMDRETLCRHLLAHPAPFPLDFSPDFLADQPLERLQHIYLALCIHTQRLPEAADGPMAA